MQTGTTHYYVSSCKLVCTPPAFSCHQCLETVHLSMVQDLLIRFKLLRGNKRKFVILDSISGVIQPGRITLLLGPPGAGKTTLLTALSGKLQGVAGLKV